MTSFVPMGSFVVRSCVRSSFVHAFVVVVVVVVVVFIVAVAAVTEPSYLA